MLKTLFGYSRSILAAACLTAILFVAIPACKKSNSHTVANITTDSTGDSLQVSSPVLVGTMTYKKDGYTLIFKNDDPYFDTAIRSKMAEEFFRVYPQLVDRFNHAATHTVWFTMTTTYDGVAATSADSTFFSSKYVSANPKDIDVVSHEIMHIVQAYHNTPSGAGWLVEGIADYARYTYGVYNKDAGWTLQSYNGTQHYTDGYGVTGHFLVWIQENGFPTIVDILDAALRNNTYGSNTWTTTTGKTLDQLWLAYSQNPALKDEMPSIGTYTDLSKGAALIVSQENASGATSAEGSLQLIDDNITTKFFTNGFVPGLYMQQHLTGASAATAYLLISGNDNPDRDPKSWQLLGSNDGSSWTPLDSPTGQMFATRGLAKTYTFTNTTAYSYYKLVISANNGSTDFQLTEWRMLN